MNVFPGWVRSWPFPRSIKGWWDLTVRGPSEDTRDAWTATVYQLWLIAFVLKMLGSSWDMSWHFMWLRDDLAPPHLLNTVGTVMAVALVFFGVRYSIGADRLAKNLMTIGVGTFLIAIPIDILNHRLNGLDITAWSISHALLYLGTAFMLLGVIRGHWRSTASGPSRTIVSAVFWGFFLENVLFPSQHQEYGTVSLANWEAGTPTAEPELLKFAADQIGRSVDLVAVTNFTQPVDSWVYPAWMVGAALLTLVAARHFVGARWTATLIVTGYLAYRLVAWFLLAGAGFPKSIPPFLLVGGAIAIDLVFLTVTSAVARAVLGTILATSATAGMAWFQARATGAPLIDEMGYLYGALALLIGWALLGSTPVKHHSDARLQLKQDAFPVKAAAETD